MIDDIERGACSYLASALSFPRWASPPLPFTFGLGYLWARWLGSHPVAYSSSSQLCPR
jgi:hypothetical protein